MKNWADELPPEVAQQIHPDWRKNEAEYWAVRDRLVLQYQDQWIGFADGAVLAAGRSAVEVFHQAMASGQHLFFTCVGREDQPTRFRRTTFAYDASTPWNPCQCSTLSFASQLALQGCSWIGLSRTPAQMHVSFPGLIVKHSIWIPPEALR